MNNFYKIFFIAYVFCFFAQADADLEKQIEDMRAEIDSLAEAIEEGVQGEPGWWTRTSIGGYGELHWEMAHKSNDLNTNAKVVDAHRYVFFIGHEFNEWLNFNSEVEIEHAYIKDGHGAVELEQMYLEQNLGYMGMDNTFVKYGIFLVPVGIINETHEPPTFYGVERNTVEKSLFANTWWEAGVLGQTAVEDNVDVTFAVHSSLDTTTGDIRDGRGKIQEQDGSSLMYTARMRYTGIAGVELAVYTNYAQDFDNTAASGEISGQMWGGHINMSPTEGFGFRGLYGWWDLDCDTTHACNTNGYAHQWGGYIEPSYRWSIGGAMDSSFGVFSRISFNDEKADSSTTTGTSAKVRQYDYGFNYWLSPNAVLKVDYENTKTYSDNKGTHGFNFGMGYQF
tara:strand:- start:769 stop:1953 length:1185 start_codon:yes stop_codon:yes gene_type:complete